jgi:hypothetical protein
LELDLANHLPLAQQLLDACLQNYNHGHCLFNGLVSLFEFLYQQIVYVVPLHFLALQFLKAVLKRGLPLSSME